MNEDIVQLLANYITTTILKQPRRVLQPTEPLISSGLIDSLSLVDLAMFVEDTFQVRIDDTELNAETFDTFGELVELIQQRQSR
jgi:acyl carrier protein